MQTATLITARTLAHGAPGGVCLRCHRSLS